MIAPVRVLGIGSPFGDDRIGWLAAEALEKVFDPARVSVSMHDRPGARLVSLMHGAEQVVLIDGVCTGAAPGTLHRLEGEAIGAAVSRCSSTHGFGLAEAIKLAQKLGGLPPCLVLWGAEIGEAEGGNVSQAVCDALPQLVGAITAEINTMVGVA